MSSIFMEFGVMTAVAFEFPAVWDKVFFSLCKLDRGLSMEFWHLEFDASRGACTPIVFSYLVKTR